MVYTCPIPSKGLSTVFAPIHVNTKITEIKNQNLNFLKGRNFLLFLFPKTKIDKIKIEAAKARTPPSLEGIDRRIT